MVKEKEILTDTSEQISQGSFEQVQHSSETSTEDLTIQDHKNNKIEERDQKISNTEMSVDKNGNNIPSNIDVDEEIKDNDHEISEDVAQEESKNEEKIFKCSCGKTIIGDGVIITEPTKELQVIKPQIKFNPKEWISFKERPIIQRALQTITSWVLKTTQSSLFQKKYRWILSSNYLSERNFIRLYEDGELLKKLAFSLTPKYKYDVVNIDQVIIDCMDFVDYNRLKFTEYCIEIFGMKKNELFSLEDFNIKKSPKGYRNIFNTLCMIALKCNEMKLGTEFINCYVFVNMKSSILEKRDFGFDVYTYFNDMKHHIHHKKTVNIAA